jgi:hypothetical protein
LSESGVLGLLLSSLCSGDETDLTSSCLDIGLGKRVRNSDIADDGLRAIETKIGFTYIVYLHINVPASVLGDALKGSNDEVVPSGDGTRGEHSAALMVVWMLAEIGSACAGGGHVVVSGKT